MAQISSIMGTLRILQVAMSEEEEENTTLKIITYSTYINSTGNLKSPTQIKLDLFIYSKSNSTGWDMSLWP